MCGALYTDAASQAPARALALDRGRSRRIRPFSLHADPRRIRAPSCVSRRRCAGGLLAISRTHYVRGL
ncbi:MAG: hypothetical protein BGO98_25335 [Myxococcales bacterium 68-20]|nr:MAG: hypothetical protein BGO98_25335 [Myxococcales bacterium 68-20]